MLLDWYENDVPHPSSLFLHMRLLFNKLENEVIQNLLLCPVWNKYMAFFPNTLINFLLRCTPFVNLSSDNFILDKLF